MSRAGSMSAAAALGALGAAKRRHLGVKIGLHRPEIGRVIFIASPLRGADLARGWFGRLVGGIIRPARLAAQASGEMLRLTNIKENELKPKRRANSLDTLSPESRIMLLAPIVRDEAGLPVSRAKAIKAGQALVNEFHDGQVRVRVE